MKFLLRQLGSRKDHSFNCIARSSSQAVCYAVSSWSGVHPSGLAAIVANRGRACAVYALKSLYTPRTLCTGKMKSGSLAQNGVPDRLRTSESNTNARSRLLIGFSDQFLPFWDASRRYCNSLNSSSDDLLRQNAIWRQINCECDRVKSIFK